MKTGGSQRKGVGMALPIKACAQSLMELLKESGWKTGLLSDDYFREVVKRKRIEEAFIAQLNSHCIDFFGFAILRISPSRYMLASVSERYFPQDPYKPLGG